MFSLEQNAIKTFKWKKTNKLIQCTHWIIKKTKPTNMAQRIENGVLGQVFVRCTFFGGNVCEFAIK